MSDGAEPRVDPDPRTLRTPQQPMAFTPDELLRGGGTVWLIFVLLLSAAVLVSAVASSVLNGASPTDLDPWLLTAPIVVAIFAGIPAGVVMVFGMLGVRPLATAMRRVRSIPVHLAVYTSLGLLIGALYLSVATGGSVFRVVDSPPWGFLTVSPALAATVAVPLGWWLTMRRARRDDARALRAVGAAQRDPGAAVDGGSDGPVC
ncbi:hypothetical protein [uncultured Microbacterium sp.]|uniref:hypothetical protein n=1 Tax=uncultured Microbacterium sp. TaxID=191216 RepID=UPI0028DB23B6|nr:hypothetical protein [uncultured Microbacterium sp.]